MLKLYDSLSRKLKSFVPADGEVFRVYACGPTVYHYATIGNLRTFATVDLLRRYLEYRGKEVKLVMNITDVGHMLNDADTGEDKMEAAAAKEGRTPAEIADFYTVAFFRDLDRLAIKRAWKHPKATEHVPEMIELVSKLIKEGKAYVTEKGDVYYDVSSFKDYGKLSGNTVEDLVAGARVEPSPDKRHPADFALWIHNPKHVLQWEAPWGKGYPGWHLECSVMAMKYLGETIDLHAGGEDLKFPHHECEIAQSEGATKKPFARHWLHVKFLLIEGEKMSKSKGNFYTLDDILRKGYTPEAIRFLLTSSHYRTQLNFTFDGLRAAAKTLESFRDLAMKLRKTAASGSRDNEMDLLTEGFEEKFVKAMDDDLNVAEALAVAHAFRKAVNKADADGRLGQVEADKGLGFLERIDGVFAFGVTEAKKEGEIPVEIVGLLLARQEARQWKDWAESDRLRKLIESKGWRLEDTSEGPKLKKLL